MRCQNSQDAIILTGYQDEESPGRALLDLARTAGPKELRLGQATVSVACSFATYGLSAHADRMQMVSFLEALDPHTVVLVHGDEKAKEALARSLRCSDVVAARDGNVLQRDYPARPGTGVKSPPVIPTAADLDIVRARHLLGPAGGTPVQAAAVAEAWFGQPVDRSTVERLARVLEGIGLVRRDDQSRDRIRVICPQDTHLFSEEAELEEQLKQANPKGRLLEFCMRQATRSFMKRARATSRFSPRSPGQPRLMGRLGAPAQYVPRPRRLASVPPPRIFWNCSWHTASRGELGRVRGDPGSNAGG
ncbi:MAG: hypothetical protein NTY19_47670 [Planctomycetota bacterium]|nr:hypothetical protein [Planctomycetota bacterium]